MYLKVEKVFDYVCNVKVIGVKEYWIGNFIWGMMKSESILNKRWFKLSKSSLFLLGCDN